MQFKLPRFKSHQISQLTLKGFNLTTRDKINKIYNPFFGFFKAILKYISKKFRAFGKFSVKFAKGTIFASRWIKAYVIRKLIWSRGRLGRPLANLIVLFVALLVFLFGEVFNSSRFVNSQEINPDYLSNVSDVIPNKSVTITLVPEERKRADSFEYIVLSGDTLSGIGEKFKISTDALKYVNGLTDYSVLSVGDVVIVPPVSGLIHTVKSGDTLASIAEKYDVATQAVADFNYILDTSSLAVGTELVIPGATVPQTVIIPSYSAYSAPTGPISIPNLADGFIWPTTARIITQYIAWYHNGIDIAVPWSWGLPPVFASSSGTVTRAGWDPWGLGLVVAINHGNGYETLYGHMSRIDVGYGQQVSKGQTLGMMGNTGRSTGPHIHFTVKYNGVPQNPLNFVQ